MINNLSFFISNEKNNSLFTQLLSDSKYIFITLLSYFILKTFNFTWKNIIGLILSTLGAVIITISSMYENIELKKNKIKLDKKRFVELSNIEYEIGSNTENKNYNINKKTDDTKDEKDDIDINNISIKSTEIEDNDNINISNNSISNNNIQNKSYNTIINFVKKGNELDNIIKESKNDSNIISNNDDFNNNGPKGEESKY